jgi:hypothetical protein
LSLRLRSAEITIFPLLLGVYTVSLSIMKLLGLLYLSPEVRHDILLNLDNFLVGKVGKKTTSVVVLTLFDSPGFFMAGHCEH